MCQKLPGVLEGRYMHVNHFVEFNNHAKMILQIYFNKYYIIIIIFNIFLYYSNIITLILQIYSNIYIIELL